MDRRESFIYDGAGLLADAAGSIHIAGPNGALNQAGWTDHMILSFRDSDADSSQSDELTASPATRIGSSSGANLAPRTDTNFRILQLKPRLFARTANSGILQKSGVFRRHGGFPLSNQHGVI